MTIKSAVLSAFAALTFSATAVQALTPYASFSTAGSSFYFESGASVGNPADFGRFFSTSAPGNTTAAQGAITFSMFNTPTVAAVVNNIPALLWVNYSNCSSLSFSMGYCASSVTSPQVATLSGGVWTQPMHDGDFIIYATTTLNVPGFTTVNPGDILLDVSGGGNISITSVAGSLTATFQNTTTWVYSPFLPFCTSCGSFTMTKTLSAPLTASPGAVLDSFDPPATGVFSGPGAAVPEPASWALMIAGFGMVGTALRRRERSMAVN